MKWVFYCTKGHTCNLQQYGYWKGKMNISPSNTVKKDQQSKPFRKAILTSFKVTTNTNKLQSVWALTILSSWLKIHDSVYTCMWHNCYYTPAPEGGGGYTVLPLSVCPSFRPSKKFFVTFFSVNIDGKNLIFGHKRHIGIPYCG